MILLAMTLVLLQVMALHNGHRHMLGHSGGDNGAIILFLTVLGGAKLTAKTRICSRLSCPTLLLEAQE
jgi:hypothetical protein